MRDFFYKYWWLYYLTFFFLLGLLIYALLWNPDLSYANIRINELNRQLEDCNNSKVVNTPITNDSIQKVDCDAEVQSGGQGTTETEHNLGDKSGNVIIEYDMKTIPDEIKVIYDNKVVAGSKGLVSSSGTIEWKYKASNGKPTVCMVVISAPTQNTEWNYVLNCPQ